ncbi:unnamed protein product, partial [Notodromas monacha]
QQAVKSGEPLPERDYLAELIPPQVRQWVQGVWRRVQAWEPPSAFRAVRYGGAKFSERDRRAMARFFKVVDLMSDGPDQFGVPSSVTMNFSLLNIWRALWGNIIDSASTFIPGLNVTWLSGHESNAPNGPTLSDQPGVVPTQLLPQLDIGDLVGLNATNANLAFFVARQLVKLPFYVGPLAGLLGLLGLINPAKRKDEVCKRGDGSYEDCPWYRRIDFMGIFDEDDDSESGQSKGIDENWLPPQDFDSLHGGAGGADVAAADAQSRQTREFQYNRRPEVQNTVSMWRQMPVEELGNRNRVNNEEVMGRNKFISQRNGNPRNNQNKRRRPNPPDYTDEIDDWAQKQLDSATREKQPFIHPPGMIDDGGNGRFVSHVPMRVVSEEDDDPNEDDQIVIDLLHPRQHNTDPVSSPGEQFDATAYQDDLMQTPVSTHNDLGTSSPGHLTSLGQQLANTHAASYSSGFAGNSYSNTAQSQPQQSLQLEEFNDYSINPQANLQRLNQQQTSYQQASAASNFYPNQQQQQQQSNPSVNQYYQRREDVMASPAGVTNYGASILTSGDPGTPSGYQARSASVGDSGYSQQTGSQQDQMPAGSNSAPQGYQPIYSEPYSATSYINITKLLQFEPHAN